MSLDDQIARAKDLIRKREEIDAELATLFGGSAERRVKRCSKCGEVGHTAPTCTALQSEGATA